MIGLGEGIVKGTEFTQAVSGPLYVAQDIPAQMVNWQPQVHDYSAEAAIPPVSAPLPAMAILTPQNIVQPLPSISDAVQPVPASCGWWSQLNGWIRDNPALALLGLFGVAVAIRRAK